MFEPGTDWISMQLVGFPVVAGIVLLAFVANAKKSAHEKLNNPIRMASFAFSLVLFGYTTAMFFNSFADTHRSAWKLPFTRFFEQTAKFMDLIDKSCPGEKP